MKGRNPSSLGPRQHPDALLNLPASVLIGVCFASKPGSFALCDMRDGKGDLRGIGRLRTNGSTRILDQRSATGLLRTRDLSISEGEPLPRESLVARFSPFLDDGYLGIGGRLQFAELSREQIHPILVHGWHHFTALLIMQTHIQLHHMGVRIVLSELREEIWILRAQQAIEVSYTCLPCKIARKTPFVRRGRFQCQPIESLLPGPFRLPV